MSLEGKVAIVTGAARGLGRAYALRLARLGADVVIVDRNIAGASEFGEQLTAATVMEEVEALGRKSIGVQADLVDAQRVKAMVAEVIEKFGRIDIIVNNAGGALTPTDRSAASVSPEEDTRFLMDINYMTTMHCCQAVVPHMKDQKEGIIVNVTSQSGITTYKGGLLSAYAASKLAVLSFTRYLAAEVGPFGIRVNAISPGVMMTARVAAGVEKRNVGTADELQNIPLRRFGQVEDCAGALEFLTTDLSQYITGQCISVCGGAVLTPH